MNHKLLSIVSAILILTVLLGASPFTYAVTQRYTTLPTLLVTTIPQDNQVLEKGIIILDLGQAKFGQDLMSQHKLLVTYNGQTIIWPVAGAGVNILCNFLEKDKVNVINDPKTGDGKQAAWENLMTKMVDVSDHFTCKARWKSPGVGLLESAGVLDVYYSGDGSNFYISDTILVVTATYAIGRSIVWGSEMQDICILGWAINANTIETAVDPSYSITKPDGTQHHIWQNAMGGFVGCEELALAQRDIAGILLPQGQDPLAA